MFTSKARAGIVGLFLIVFSGTFQAVQAQQSPINAVASIEKNDKDNSVQSLTFSQDANIKPSDAQLIFSKYLGLDVTKCNMVLKNTITTKAGITTDRYSEYYNGIKIEYGSYAVTSKAGRVSYIAGNFYTPATNLSPIPVMEEAQALTKALSYVNADLYKWQDAGSEAQIKAATGNLAATYYPKGELVWIEDYYSNQENRQLHLAYKFDVSAIKPLGRREIFVDAQNAHILYSNSLIKHSTATNRTKYSGTVSFQTARVGTSYRLYDSTRGNGVHTMSMHNTTTGSPTEITSTTNSFPTSSADTQALDAHWAAEKVYDFLFTQLGRRSWNNADGILNQYVHYDANYDNAFWDGTAMYYGDGSGVAAGGFSPLVSLDVTAHEIGHGVCEATANLIYSAESGGLNEGFSDCWGAIVENYANPHETDAVAKKVWFMGEELGAGVPLRRLDSPKLYGCPDTYRGTYWYSVTSCTPTSANDECGVHTNMGVISKWFYLITIGASGTNDNGNTYSVTGLGWIKSANILYQTELALATNANYAATRTAAINAATTLYGACSAEVQAVTNAWYAVGVGAAYSGSGSVAAIAGPSTVTIGSTATYTNTTTGGTWSVSNTTLATISATGVVTGLAAGIDTVKYTSTSACGTFTVTLPITVSVASTSADIYTYVNSTTGVPTFVNSNIPTYTNLTAIGTGSTTGCASGFSGINGFAATTYSTTGPCIQVSLTAASGKTINLTGFTTGLRRTSTGPVKARLAYSVDGGTTWINSGVDYAPFNGSCATTASGATLASWTGISVSSPSLMVRIYPYAASATTGTIQVYGLSVIGSVTSTCTTPVVGTISGASSVCPGASTTLTDTTVSGIWSSSNTAIASVSATGVVTGIAAGSVTITYSKTNSCGTGTATKAITVSAATSAGSLSGAATVCVAGTSTYSSTVTGGTWSSSNTAIATVSTTGVVTGVSTGSVTMSYTVTGACGTAVSTLAVSVISSPSAGTISGTSTICAGTTSALASTVTGGTWTTSNATIASINSTGVVTGVAAGTVTISYTVSTGCGSAVATYVVTVNPAPNAGIVSGAASLCTAATTTLTASVTGGIWSTSAATIASVNTTGVVTGIAAGTVTISYSVSNSCGTATATKVVTVSSTPTVAVITGATSVAAGSTITLSNATTGGTWSATNIRASVSAAGLVTGSTAGLDTIKYTVSTTCGIAVASYVITVTAVSSADIYTYVSSTTGVPTFVNSNIATATSLTNVGGTVTSGCAAGFSGLSGYAATTFATTNPSIQVSLTAATGFTINVTGFTAGLRRSSTGPAKARLAYSINGGTTWVNSGVDYLPLNAGCATSTAGTTVASWTGFSVTNPSILLRIYPYAATAATGTLQIYGLSVIGSLTAAKAGGSGSQELNVDELMAVYPNPNNGRFNVVLPVSKEAATITVFDLNGRVIINRAIDAADRTVEIDLSKYATGTYLVKAVVDGKIFTQQVQTY